jgi:hypothetical protein
VARIQASPPESSGEFVSDQYPVLKRDFYGVLFRSYTLPVKKTNMKTGEPEEMFYAHFLVTHTSRGEALPEYSDAWCKVRTKMFYDDVSKAQSTYHALLAALLSGKRTAEDILHMCDANELPDLDELICYPLTALIEPAQQPDKNGVTSNFISTRSGPFAPPSPEFKQAAIAIYKSAKFDTDGKGLRYLKDPKPTIVRAGTRGPSNGAAASDDEWEGIDDAAPF